ncbi:MAG TPA: tyrosine-type recombinase/integrase [Bacteroidales bacterium]|nr:tyrosine-type recombinase/integrase [Bacteroidales bacterium]
MTEIIIDEYFKNIEAKPSTIKGYSQGFKHFTKFHSMTMEQLIEESEEDQVNKVVPRKQRLIKRLNDFNSYLIEQEYSPNARALYLTAVKSFYKNYGVIVPRIGQTKKKRRIKVENQWTGFTREEISRHLKAHTGLRDKALILLISSSGLAKKEVRNLIRADFENAQDSDGVTTFRLRREKTGFDFYTFCSPEATRAINDYLKSRTDSNKYLFVTQMGDKIKEETWSFIFKNLNKRLGIKRDDNQFSQTRSHNYRKWFNSTLQNNGCPMWFVDFCMAHETSEVRAHYHLADPEKLKEIYVKYMHLLYIEDKSFEVLKDDEIKRLNDSNKQQAAEIKQLRAEMTEGIENIMKKVMAAGDKFNI